MPNQPKTPLHAFRLDAELWRDFGDRAGDRTAVLRNFIRWYMREPGARMPRRPSDDGRSSDPEV